MLRKLSNASTRLVNRWLPDSFIFCILLAIVVFIFAMPASGLNPFQVINAFGGGVWNLLAFSMQMVLVLVLGQAFATAPAIKKFICKLARIPKKPSSAIAFITLISMICMWANWGFGLVVGVLLAKECARQVKGLDYRLAIAASYSSIAIWHAGFSGSIPLAMSEFNETLMKNTGGVIDSAAKTVPTSQTIFSPWNLIIIVVIVIVVSLINARMHPKAEDVVEVDPELLKDEEQIVDPPAKTPAERCERSRILTWITVIMFVVYIGYSIKEGTFSLSLNTVNLIFLILGMAFHGTPISYVRAVTAAAKGSAGIILQFPFYAGIAGMMVAVGPEGNSLALVISRFFVNISTVRTFPLFSYLSAGIVNFFVPSGGGQWSVQGPLLLPAGAEIGVSPAITSMAIAWGDAWTNLLQPFWALPALGIAKLGARDIMGYCAVILIVTGIITSLGFLFLVPIFA